MAEGTVKWFDPRKGYGFITADDGREVFVHHTSLVSKSVKNLVEGQMVTFDVVAGEKGPKADCVNVKLTAAV